VRTCLIDGEVVCCDERGARFDVLRRRRSKALHGLRLNEHLAYDCGVTVFQHACALGCEGIVSKRLGSRYRSGRSPDWLKFKNPAAPAVGREAEEDWGRRGKL
jgi:ATP-dependent DNA ligase